MGTLHDLVAQKIQESQIKLAAAQQEPNPKSDKDADKTEKEKKKKVLESMRAAEGGGSEEKEASLHIDHDGVDKLASAVEFIADNIHEVEDSRTNREKLATAIQKVAEGNPGSMGTVGSSMVNRSDPQPVPKAHAKLNPPVTIPLVDGNAIKADDKLPPVQTKDYPEKGVLVQQSMAGIKPTTVGGASDVVTPNHKIAKANLIDGILAKMAEEGASPKTGGDYYSGNYFATPDGVGVPATPSGQGNEARKLIQSNEAVINATKREAKAPVKKQLKEILTEPAQSNSTDDVLSKTFQKTNEAGAKYASMLKQASGKGQGASRLRSAIDSALEKKASAKAHGGFLSKIAQDGMPVSGGAPPEEAVSEPQPDSIGVPEQTGDPTQDSMRIEAVIAQKKADIAKLQQVKAEIKAAVPPAPPMGGPAPMPGGAAPAPGGEAAPAPAPGAPVQGA